MIISQVYPGDENEILMQVQYDEYDRNIGRIFSSARDELAHADAILDAKLLITDTALAVKRFDHRVLQDAHDIIAAAFRYHNDDGGQLRLFEDAEKQLARYAHEWNEWLGRQLLLFLRYPVFVRSVVECVVFANNVMGYMAEDRLCAFLLSYYNAVDWMKEDGYLKVYKLVSS